MRAKPFVIPEVAIHAKFKKKHNAIVEKRRR